jgi:hypothetical protein
VERNVKGVVLVPVMDVVESMKINLGHVVAVNVV